MTHDHPSPAPQESFSSWNLALSATIHCLTGCAIGEVLGMVIVVEVKSAARAAKARTD